MQNSPLLLQVYYKFDESLRGFIRGRIDDIDLVEDILQDVYLKVHDNIGNINDPMRLNAWIYQITRNAIVDQYRRNRPTVELTDNLIAYQSEESDLYEELASSLYRMLNFLPNKYRDALILADLYEMKQEEVAVKLGLSHSGAKSRVQRARQKLKQAFIDSYQIEFDQNGRITDIQPN